MPETMKAAVVPELGQPLDVQEVPVPMPGPFEALVKVEYTGVCHTDLHAVQGDWPVKPTAPFIPGHEGVGTVTAVGDQVTRVKVGDKVGNAWLASACGACEYCETGWETLCPHQENSGYSVDGSFGQYMLVDSRYCPLIPDGVDLAAAAPVLCAGVTVYKGLKVTDTKPGEWVLVSGIGGLGHIAVQYAVAMGLRVAAIDIEDSKLELARKHGAEVTVNAQTSDDPVAELTEATGGVHGALVTAVNAHAFPQAVGCAAARGHRHARGAAAGEVPARHLHHGALRPHRARLDRRHAQGHDRGARLLRPRQDQPHLCDPADGGHQRDLRRDDGRGHRRPHRPGDGALSG